MFGLFKPVAHIGRLPEGQIDPIYKRLRWQLFLSIFIGYAGYYLVRKNFTLAMPFLIEEYGYSRGDLGVALAAVSIAYGLLKFLMGIVSDRSNPRYFLAAGLVMSALVMLCFGLMPWATGSITAMFILLFLNGCFRGWAGLPADELWFIGGLIRSATVLFRFGMWRITSAEA